MILALALALPIAGLAGCDDSDGPTDAEIETIVAQVRLSLNGLSLFPGETRDLVATALDAAGGAIDPSKLPSGIVWSSSDATVVSVSQTGQVTALRSGSATVSATAGTASAAITVTVVEVPTSVVSLGGTMGTGNVGGEVRDGVRMQLRDALGRGVRGIRVRFTVLSGNGSVSPAEVVTDQEGLARTSWTLGPTAGEQRLEVRALLSSGASGAAAGAGPQASAPADLVVVFTATAEPAAASLVTLTPGTQSLASGTSSSVEAAVTDGFGNVVSGATVSFSSSAPDVANPNSTGAFVGGKAGTAVITATLDSNPAVAGVATVTVTPGLPRSMSKISGDAQSGTPGAALPDPMVVEVRDGAGNLVPGATVQWSVTSGSGTVAAGTSLTDAAGRASMSLTFGATAGAVLVQAAVSGAGSVLFSAASAFAPLAIVTASPLPSGVESVGYATTLTASGGSGVYTWSLAGAPTWLSIGASSGALSGTAQPGSYSFTVNVSSSDGQSVSKGFTLQVTYSPLQITTASPLPEGQNAAPYAVNLGATGGNGPYTWSLAGAPAWLTVNSSTGALSGTAQAGVFSFEIRVASADGQAAAKDVTLQVVYPSLTIATSTPLPQGTRGVSYGLTLSAAGGDGSYTWSLSGAPAWLTVNPSSGQLSGTAQTGSFSFTVTVASGDGQVASKVVELAVVPPPLNITTASPLPAVANGAAYSQTITATGGEPPYAWSVTGAPGWLSMDPSTGVLSGTAAAGVYNFTVNVSSLDQDSQKAFSLTVTGGGAFPTLDITTTSLPAGTRTVAYSQNLAATGGDGTYTWAITTGVLPPGLGLNVGTGQISGTPTAAGTANFTVQVTSGDAQSDTQALSITVAHPAPVITTASLPDGTRTVAYSQTLTATGGDGTTYAWSVSAGTLPAGLSLNGSTGQISGTPTAAGTANFTIQVTSGGLSATRNLSITIAHPAPVVTTASLPDGTRTVAYSQTLAATGGDGTTYTWALSAGALPTGLTLNAGTGQISGTPTAAGTANFTVQVTSGGLSATRALSITVAHPAPIITTASLPNGTRTVAYSQTLAATGGDDVTYAWAITAGSLIAGLTLNTSTGAISGTPTAAGTANFTVQVTSGGLTGTANLSLTVVHPPPVVTTTTLPNGQIGNAYSQTVLATGGDGATYTWAVTAGSLPGGLTLNAGTGAITGTPTAPPGTFNFTIQVTSASQTDTQALSITTVYPPPSIQTASLLDVLVGFPYDEVVVSTGGDGTYTWAVTSGSLPTGVSLNASTGALTGTANVLGSYTFTIQVTSAAQTDSESFTINVNTSNEPAGFTAIVDRPFNTKAANNSDRGTGDFPNKTGGSEGWDGIEWNYPNLSIAASTDPLSPANAMRVTYPAGLAQNTGPAVFQTQSLGGSPRDLYVRSAIRLGPDYYVGFVSNKLYFHRMAGSPRGEPFLALHNNPSGTTFRLAANFQGTPDNGLGWFFAPGKGAAIEREKWYVIETLLIMNSAEGAKDGIFRLWLNGALLIERTNVEYRPTGGGSTWDALHVSPTYGGDAAPNVNAFHFDFGHAYVSGRS